MARSTWLSRLAHQITLMSKRIVERLGVTNYLELPAEQRFLDKYAITRLIPTKKRGNRHELHKSKLGQLRKKHTALPLLCVPDPLFIFPRQT